MTLYRQLIIFTLLLFLLLFTGTWFAKFESTRSFLINQLASHAQDTATSLGLSISPHVANSDMPSVESMINAVFDRGYYETIKYTDANDKVVIERNLKVKIENVPQWFIDRVPLQTPEATANVMSGWRQAGSIYVKSHPGYAYNTLWRDVFGMTLWFLACGIFVLVGGAIGLRVLLKPLFLVERQADALCRKEYEIQERLPWTRELRRVVQAMNRMTSKIKEMFEEQVAHAEGLRERAYHDPLTGLGNRRYFESQINAWLDRPDPITKGMIMIIQIHELAQLNQQKGFQAGDALLKRAGELIKDSLTQHENIVFARLTGSDFGIFLPEAQSWEAETLAQAMSDHLRELAREKLSVNDNVGHVGTAVFDIPVTLTRLLAEADLSLATARQIGANAWSLRMIGGETEKIPLGQLQWKDMLELSLKERRISLDAQPVVNADDRSRVLHLEIFSRIIKENGELLSAALFMPFAERLKLVSLLDRIVLEKVMLLNRIELGIEKVAVNFSAASLQDQSFRQWIESALEKFPATAPQLIFEFPEFSVVQNLSLLKDFSGFVRKYGHGIGLDHYGQSFSHLGYLQSIRPDYVKIDRAYTGELKEEGSDSRFYIESLCSVAHSIDIAVIAEGVETEQQYQILKGLNIDAVQGYFIERPKPLKSLIKNV